MDQSFMPDASEVPTGRGRLFRDWARRGRYKSHDIAQKVVSDALRKHDLWEFHIGEKP